MALPQDGIISNFSVADYEFAHVVFVEFELHAKRAAEFVDDSVVV